MYKSLTSAILTLTLGGCATCQNHPVYCAVGTAIVVGSVAAIAAQHNGSPQYKSYVQKVIK